MIAFAYNDNMGGILEYELRLASSAEVQLGLKYRASGGRRFVSSSILSSGAYSPDGLTLLYLDQLAANLPIRYRSSFVNAATMNPWGGTAYDPHGAHVSFAGYGPNQKLLYAIYPWRGFAMAPGDRWWLYLAGKHLTETAGHSPVYAPDLARIFFVESGDDDTIRSTNEAGGAEAVVKRFKGGWIRGLAITQNRSGSKWDRVSVGEELLVSVYYPNEGQTVIYSGLYSGFSMSFKKRFSVPSDWVMVAGTGIFGNGTRILFTSGQDLRIWDNRDGSINDIREWKTQDDNHHDHYAIPPFRHYVQGTGLAISPEAATKQKKKAKRSAMRS